MHQQVNVMQKSKLMSWCHSYHNQGGVVPGPPKQISASATLKVGERQSREWKSPGLTVVWWIAEGVNNKKPELEDFIHKKKTK